MELTPAHAAQTLRDRETAFKALEADIDPAFAERIRAKLAYEREAIEWLLAEDASAAAQAPASEPLKQEYFERTAFPDFI